LKWYGKWKERVRVEMIIVARFDKEVIDVVGELSMVFIGG